MVRSESLLRDMESLRQNRHHPFLRSDGSVDIDAYIDEVIP